MTDAAAFLFSWYKKTELGTRVAMFFTSATIAGAFGGWPYHST